MCDCTDMRKHLCLNYIYILSQTHTQICTQRTTSGASDPVVNALPPPTTSRHLTPRPVLNTCVAIRVESWEGLWIWHALQGSEMSLMPNYYTATVEGCSQQGVLGMEGYKQYRNFQSWGANYWDCMVVFQLHPSQRLGSRGQLWWVLQILTPFFWDTWKILQCIC